MMNQWTSALKYIPFYTEGVGWIVPAIVGMYPVLSLAFF